MCTLILGVDLVEPGSVILAANRDEDPARPSEGPGVLRAEPRVVGGRDARKGGTWLAIRERRAAVAMLNRREDSGPGSPTRRSRGLLALEVAAAGDGSPAAALECAQAALRESEFAPFSMLYASPLKCWLIAWDGASASVVAPIAPGWHAITHADLDDPAEPRTRWIAGRLAGFAPANRDEAERRLLDLLRSHGMAAATGAGPAPPVCLHEGIIRTVSTSIVYLAREEARYVHIEGRPCTGAALDCAPLLAGPNPARQRIARD
jgi:uncharacterized protein with NRDE domain